MTKVLLCVALAALVGSGCTNDDGVSSVLPGGQGVKNVSIRFPSQIAGLTVDVEDVSETVEQIKRPYVDSLTMFSFREGDLARATLQVSRFNRLARPDDSEFIGTIVGLVGTSTPRELKIGEHIVHSTVANKQNKFVWFNGKGMFVLSVTQDYQFPRTLLRRVVEQEIEL